MLRVRLSNRGAHVKRSAPRDERSRETGGLDEKRLNDSRLAHLASLARLATNA